MRSSCMPPKQPVATQEEQSHPLYSAWLNYKAACGAQLVTAATFESWVAMHEREELRKKGLLPYQLIDAHPRGHEYWDYCEQMRIADKPTLSFDDWLLASHNSTTQAH